MTFPKMLAHWIAAVSSLWILFFTDGYHSDRFKLLTENANVTKFYETTIDAFSADSTVMDYMLFKAVTEKN